MIKQLAFFFLLLLCIQSFNAQSQSESPVPHLLGKIKRAALMEAPYAEWYNQQLAYTPNQEIIAQLKIHDLSQYNVQIFFGSWCGDSRREMPRFLKVLDELNFSADKVEIIGVATGERYKQSPEREEIGKAIYRVPTFILYKGDVEQGRIVEYPVFSLERDLLLILQGKEYTPNYYSFPFLTRWQNEGILKDKNVDVLGLANQVRGKVVSPSELNAAGYVFLYRGEQQEAIKVFRINTFLFPEVANTFDSLGEAFMAANQNEDAIWAYEMAQKLEPENEHVKEMLAKLKGIAEGTDGDK